MSFLDRYEFEQILDEDLAVSRDRWQAETANTSQPQLSSAPKFEVSIGRTILIGLTAVGLGFTLLHQSSFASHPHPEASPTALMMPNSH